MISKFVERESQTAVPITPTITTGEYQKDTLSVYSHIGSNIIEHDIQQRQVKRQIELRNFCRGHQALAANQNRRMGRNLIYSDIQGVVYCYIPKVACTNWKRMLQVFDGNIQDPLEISNKQEVHKLKYSHLNKLTRRDKEWRKDVYYSFIFVRHPFERLLSTYRNKFLDPYNARFQKIYGSKILKLYRQNLTSEQYKEGKHVTFKEFIDFLISVYEGKGAKNFDEHWQVMHTLCTPCSIKYNYIGKMDTLLQDANQVLKDLGLYGKAKFPVNATDKYKFDIKGLMRRYYSTLSTKSLGKLYEIYEDDFVSFGYKMPNYL